MSKLHDLNKLGPSIWYITSAAPFLTQRELGARVSPSKPDRRLVGGVTYAGTVKAMFWACVRMAPPRRSKIC